MARMAKYGKEAVALQRKFASGARRQVTLYKKAYEGARPNLQKAGFITGGGALAGFSKANIPNILGVPTPLIAGSALIAGSLVLGTDKKIGNDDMAYALLCIGSGMLAVAASDYVEDMLTTTSAPASNGMAIAQ